MAALAFSLTPAGKIRVSASTPDADGAGEVLDGAARRIVRAFADGTGPGLLRLGAAELQTQLPAEGAWLREIGHRFMAALCAVPELDEVRDAARLAPPRGDLEAWVAAAPPFIGGEYLSTEIAASLWEQIGDAFRSEIRAHDGTVQEWLRACDPVWNRVGRVVLHLAENKGSTETPFAFIATYTAGVSRQGTVRHVPLGRAVEDSGEKRDRDALLVLLEPLHRASETSALAKELVESGDVFHPVAWTPREAHRFLKEVPALESAGVIVRVPEWWNSRRTPRPTVTVTVGSKRPGGVGAEALLDFDVTLSLDGEPLTPAERRALERATDGLALIRGRWVELDRDAIARTLAHWKSAEKAAREGLSFRDALRLVSGADAATDGAADAAVIAEWSGVSAGPWLSQTLDGLRSPEGLAAAKPGRELQATLRPYQEVGVRWLWSLHSLGLGGCLADDMGLGKTLQLIAILLLRKKHRAGGRALLVVPASLIANWQHEIARFAPSLAVGTAHPSELAPDDDGARVLAGADVVITSYGCVSRYPWLRDEHWGLVALDEAQAIKNPGAKQTHAVKALRGTVRLALTGTPMENRLSDLWSIFDFTSPGLLGSAKDFGAFAKRMERGDGTGFAPLRNLIRPYVLRRLKTDRSVISDLPDKTEMVAFCPLRKPQAILYQQAVDDLARELRGADGIRRRGVVLASMMRLKQICNHPSQWLRDGDWRDDASGKFARLRELCEPIAARQEKALVFTQFREVTGPLSTFLAGVFRRTGLVLHGETTVARRGKLVEEFQEDGGPPFFVLSLKAGGTGLNLTAASHVVHFDRWWNPAVENQATDRAFRIGQKRNVIVHKLVCRGTIEERIDRLIESKRELQDQLLGAGAENLITELPTEEILRLVSLDLRAALDEG